MKLTGTHTLATLEISHAAHSEIWNLLERANYEHALDREGRQIDMTGIALVPSQGIKAELVRSADDLIRTAAILTNLTPEQLVELSKRLENDRTPPIMIEAESSIPTTVKSYRHHKGGTYTVLAIARSSEQRDELLAVYTSHQTQQVWVRPWSMFNEIVEWPDGVRRPRFVEMPTMAEREALARVQTQQYREKAAQDLLCRECGHPAASHRGIAGVCTDCDKCTGYE